MLSYLLHTLDYEFCEKKVSEFKAQIQTIARSLDDSLVVNRIERAKVLGERSVREKAELG